MRVFSYTEAASIVPLVKVIVRDLMIIDSELRQMLYTFGDDVFLLDEHRASTNNRLRLINELEALGCTYHLVSIGIGEVRFSTIINDREAYFSWKSHEATLSHYVDVQTQKRQRIPDEITHYSK